MIETTTTIDIARPADEVFDYVADMSNNPEWQQGMRSCRWTTEPPVGVGSRYDQLATFLGKVITSRFEVTEFEPGRRIRIVTYESTFGLDITRMVEPIDATTCRVTAIVLGEQAGIFKFFGPLLNKMVAASVKRDYQGLQQILEAG